MSGPGGQIVIAYAGKWDAGGRPGPPLATEQNFYSRLGVRPAATATSDAHCAMKMSLFRRRRRAGSAVGQRTLNRHRLGLEQLEQRRLLAIDSGLGAPAFGRCDVNHDGLVSGLDALLVINHLNKYGAEQVSSPMAARASLAGAATPTADPSLASFDVNGDGMITGLDALNIINQLNDPVQVSIRLAVTDTNGTPITQISAGGQFLLKVFVKDLRGVGADGGVFQAYTDVTFDSALAHVTGSVVFNNPPYGSGQLFDTGTPGLINETGALDGLDPLGDSERLLFSVPMQASGAGTLVFQADPADGAGHDVLLYGLNQAVPPADIDYGSATLEVSALPTVTIDDVTKLEGNGGTPTTFDFKVHLSSATDSDVTIHYSTADDTATAGSDYVGQTDQVATIPAGQTSTTISIPVNGDATYESDETFFINLISVSANATIADSQAQGTILNDDAPPTLSIGDVSQQEGNSGPGQFTFNVTLNGATELPVTVNYATVDDTATTADGDYTSKTGQLTFQPGGPASQSITVVVNGDTKFETNETFFVDLSGASGAVIIKARGTGTIQNDDSPPAISISHPLPITEPQTGTTDLIFTVTLSGPSALPVSVDFATSPNTANANDFEPTSGTLNFAPNETEKQIAVPIKADALQELDETFFVDLANASGGTIADGHAVGTIRDLVLDKLARISFEFTDLGGTPISQVKGGQPFYLNVYVQDERAAAQAAGVFQAYLNVNFDPALLSVDANSFVFGDNYQNGIKQGVIDGTLGTITDVGAFDGLDPLGPDRQLLFKVQVTGLAGGTATVNGGPSPVPGDDVLLYNDNDPVPPASLDFLSSSVVILPPPLITVVATPAAEGNSGTNNPSLWTVILDRQGDQTSTFTVHYATTAGTATAGVDYQDVSGTLTFAPGVSTQQVGVPVVGDLLNEADETILLNLSNASGAVIAPGSQQVAGTIRNDDPPPVVSVGNVTAIEGSTNANFAIHLSAPSGQTVTVHYATADGTATAGSDYLATSGTLTFAPGETEKPVSVPVRIDQLVEGPETFFLNLSGIQNATPAELSATATINDFPLATIAGYVFVDNNLNGSRDGGDTGLQNVTIQLTGQDMFGGTVNVVVKTTAGGAYQFNQLLPGTYTVKETQPGLYDDGPESLGTAGGGISANDQFTITITAGANAVNYNFAEHAKPLTDDIFYAR